MISKRQISLVCLASMTCLLVSSTLSAQTENRRQRINRIRQRQDQDQDDQTRNARNRSNGAPQVGDKAPEFSLKPLVFNEKADAEGSQADAPDSEEATTLKGLIANKPVVLIFGSYT